METETRYAISILKEDHKSGVTGVVRFTHPKDGLCHISASIKGLAEGKHGFHVHEYGNLLEGCTTAGEHYNPFKKNHAGPFDAERHVGDMGNVVAGANGEAHFEHDDPLISLWGEHNVIGRSVVVHTGEDDFGKGGHVDSLTTGHAGGRLACGEIGISGAFK